MQGNLYNMNFPKPPDFPCSPQPASAVHQDTAAVSPLSSSGVTTYESDEDGSISALTDEDAASDDSIEEEPSRPATRYVESSLDANDSQPTVEVLKAKYKEEAGWLGYYRHKGFLFSSTAEHAKEQLTIRSTKPGSRASRETLKLFLIS